MHCSFVVGPMAVVVAVDGRVDESTWESFGDGLRDGIDRGTAAGRCHLVVDLAALDYMSSRGLRALTLAKRHADASGVTITLAAPNEVMREILAISRYDKLFAVTDTVEPAA